MADDNQEHITAREFDQRMAALMDAMTDGFTGVNARIGEVKGELREMNSKVATQQYAITELRAESAANKVQVLEHSRKLGKIDTGFRHARKDDAEAPKGDLEPITMKDLKRALWVAGGLLTLIGGLVKWGPWVLKAIAQDGAP